MNTIAPPEQVMTKMKPNPAPIMNPGCIQSPNIHLANVFEATKQIEASLPLLRRCTSADTTAVIYIGQANNTRRALDRRLAALTNQAFFTGKEVCLSTLFYSEATNVISTLFYFEASRIALYTSGRQITTDFR